MCTSIECETIRKNDKTKRTREKRQRQRPETRDQRPETRQDKDMYGIVQYNTVSVLILNGENNHNKKGEGQKTRQYEKRHSTAFNILSFHPDDGLMPTEYFDTQTAKDMI
jgi:hypothetical protein